MYIIILCTSGSPIIDNINYKLVDAENEITALKELLSDNKFQTMIIEILVQMKNHPIKDEKINDLVRKLDIVNDIVYNKNQILEILIGYTDIEFIRIDRF